MRRISTWNYLCCLLMAWAIASCDISSLEDAIIVPDVDDEFYVDMWENLDGLSGRELVIKLESIKSEKCLNYRIDYQFLKDGNRLKIDMNSIIKPLDCVPGEATVKQDVNAGNLLNGLYALDINLKNTINNDGQLVINDDSYVLDMERENGISLRHKELQRVPSNAIWGYVEYAQKADESNARKFVEELSALSGSFNEYRVGYYGYFTINSANRAVSVNGQSALSIPYLFKYQNNEAKVKNLLSSYRQNYGTRLSINFYNAKGENW